MLFTLEVLPALEGDCLLLHWGSVQAPKLAIIDGGPGNVYEDFLRPRLDEIRVNRPVDQLKIELAMISHVDGDHIKGVLKLLRALKADVDTNIPEPQRRVMLKRLWHNTFNDILGDDINAYYDNLTATLTASLTANGEPTQALVDTLADAFETRQNASPETARALAADVAMLLASHADGRNVRVLHEALRKAGVIATLNHPFVGAAGTATLITTESTPGPKTVAGLDVRIIGPATQEILKLQKDFDDYIKLKGLSTQAMLAAHADRSVSNLSSIVCMLSHGGRRILLTGDALGDKILAGLENAGLLAPGGTLHVDVLKVQHHGSSNNATRTFFERVTADCYVFSGDGKHGNPDRETLEWLVAARGKNADYQIILTYDVAHIDPIRKAEHEKKQVWVPDKHSLAAMFAEHQAEAYAYTLITGAPVQIDLGDEALTF